MSTNVRDKEIKVQRAAQSLDHFKSKVAGAEDAYVGILKPVLFGAGIVLLALLGWAGFASLRSKSLGRHEAALAEVLRYVEGDGTTPLPAAEAEKRMKEKLPVLEQLARTAPASEKAVAEGIASGWRLMLGQAGATAATAEPKTPWDRLRAAQRSLALGRGEEAARLLAPLRKDATPQEAWGRLYWTLALDCDRLQGNRAQALKDLAEFKDRFKNLPEANSLDNVVKSI